MAVTVNGASSGVLSSTSSSTTTSAALRSSSETARRPSALAHGAAGSSTSSPIVACFTSHLRHRSYRHFSRGERDMRRLLSLVAALLLPAAALAQVDRATLSGVV